MKQKLLGGVFIALTVIGLAGCPHRADIYNVDNTAVATTKADYTLTDVRAAIIRAGAGLGWQITDAGPDTLQGTLYLRSHIAKVSIPYSKTAFSIQYLDSTNLDYDGSKIHSNYNGWIQNLNNAIIAQLGTM